MPFEKVFPRSFTAMSIRQHAPAMSGVYGLSNARGWIYIGESGNIQDSLMDHLLRTNTVILDKLPTGFVFEVCAHTSRGWRHQRLIVEYAPACNRQ
ncbi:MAG: hypothetical protein ACKV2U_16295 [Bryobacteraceae bacterium]